MIHQLQTVDLIRTKAVPTEKLTDQQLEQETDFDHIYLITTQYSGLKQQRKTIAFTQTDELLCDHDESPHTRLHPNKETKSNTFIGLKDVTIATYQYIFVDPEPKKLLQSLFTTCWQELCNRCP